MFGSLVNLALKIALISYVELPLQVDSLLPKHFLPPIIRLCGKLEMLDRLLPKLKATGHRVMNFTVYLLVFTMFNVKIW